MSDDIRKLQAQIGILTEKASDLEVICAYIIENFSLEDTSDQSRQIAATELRRPRPDPSGQRPLCAR